MDNAEIGTELAGDLGRVTVTGEVDLVEAQRLQRAVLDLVDGGARELVVDLSGVSFMGSTGLGALVVGHNRLLEEGGSLTLRNPSKAVRRVLEITSLDQVLPID